MGQILVPSGEDLLSALKFISYTCALIKPLRFAALEQAVKVIGSLWFCTNH